MRGTKKMSSEKTYRLRLGSSFLIGIPALFALGAGIWLGANFVQSKLKNSEDLQLDNLTFQTRFLSQNINDQIYELKKRSLGVSSGETLHRNDTILSWARLKIEGNQVLEIRDQQARPGWGPNWVTLGSLYSESIASKMNVSDARKNGINVLRVRKSQEKRTEWLAIGFFHSSGFQKSKNDEIHVALVDPSKVFSIFKSFSKAKNNKNERAYLLAHDGSVIIHSQPSYAGADFSQSEVYFKGARTLFKDQKIEGHGQFIAIDELPVLASFTKSKNFPFGVIVERPVPKNQASWNTPSLEVWQDSFSQLLKIFFVLFLFGALCRWALKVRVKKVINQRHTGLDTKSIQSTLQQKKKLQEQLTEAPQNPTQASIRSTGRSTGRSTPSAPIATLPSDALNQFMAHASLTQDPKIIGKLATQTATKICEQPSLFFRFKDEGLVASLEADFGFPEDLAPRYPLSLRLEGQAVAQIRKCIDMGRTATLANYEPLNRILFQELRVDQFEAWVLSDGRNILGILVVIPPQSLLQTSQETGTHAGAGDPLGTQEKFNLKNREYIVRMTRIASSPPADAPTHS